MTLTSDDYTREIRRLHGIIAERDELIIQLQDMLAASTRTLPNWLPRMTPIYEDLLRLLINRDIVSRTAMNMVLHSGEQREHSVYGVHILNLRRKVEPLGIEIHCIHRSGYFLTPESKARLKQETITWPLPSNPAPSRTQSANATSPASASTALPIPSPSA